MSLKEYVKGSAEYFAERERRLQANIDEAKSKIDAIETKIRDEIRQIQQTRDTLHHHLSAFIQARNEIYTSRTRTKELITQLENVVAIAEREMPDLDSALDQLETEYIETDAQLEETEKSRHRQLHKHERKKTRYELRKTRLELRKKLFNVEAAAKDIDEKMTRHEAEIVADMKEGA